QLPGELAGLEKREDVCEDVGSPHDERVGAVHHDPVAHSLELRAFHSHLPIALRAEDASEDRIGAFSAGDDAHLERWWRDAPRDAVLVRADLLACGPCRESIDAKIAKAVRELAAMVRRCEHDDATHRLWRETAPGDRSAEHDASHRVRHDVDW